VPRQQRFGSDNRGELRQSTPPEPLRSGSEPTTLVVCETNSASSELFAQDTILLAQIVDCLLLVLIHPARDGDQHEPEGIGNAHGSNLSSGITSQWSCAWSSTRLSLWTVRDQCVVSFASRILSVDAVDQTLDLVFRVSGRYFCFPSDLAGVDASR
jgi:hypothetical protein